MSTSEVQRNTSTQNWQELGATDTTQKSALHKGFVSGDGITGITYSAGTPSSNAVNQTQVAEYLKSLTAINPNAITEDTAIEFFNAIESFGASITLSNEITQEDLNLAKQVEDLLKKPTISDFDIRELMKLLIKAFSQLLNSQRQVTLNTITNIITALKAKIADMEKSRDENYHAALASAIGTIVMGSLQVIGGTISAIAAGYNGSKLNKLASAGAKSDNLSGNPKFQKIIKDGELWANIGQATGYVGQVANGIAGIINAHFQAEAKDADIDSTIQDAIMEVLRKMQDEGSNEFKQLLQFISTLLQMLHELQQNASSTEKTIVQA